MELSCLIPNWSWNWNFGFQMSMPVVIVLFFVGKTVGSALMLRMKRQKESSDPESLSHLAWSRWSTLIGMTNVLYLTLSKYSLMPFRCTDLPWAPDPVTGALPDHPRSVLTVNPTMECGSTEHRMFQVLGGVGVAVYLVGYPLMIICVLVMINKNNSYCKEKTIMLWGVLYTKYEARSSWYEVISVLKRTVFAFIAVFDDIPNVQVQLLPSNIPSTPLLNISTKHPPLSSKMPLCWLQCLSMPSPLLLHADVAGQRTSLTPDHLCFSAFALVHLSIELTAWTKNRCWWHNLCSSSCAFCILCTCPTRTEASTSLIVSSAKV